MLNYFMLTRLLCNLQAEGMPDNTKAQITVSLGLFSVVTLFTIYTHYRYLNEIILFVLIYILVLAYRRRQPKNIHGLL